MTEKPLISILTGIYNCADTLEEAVDSILAQTYTNWELILCEDGSKDNTYEVAKSLADKYPDKIRLLRNDRNYGLNRTLNNCLAAAKGKYIARMDGDDLSVPDRLEKEVVFLENHPEFAIVSSPMIYYDENGEWGRGSSLPEPTLKDFALRAPVFCHAPCMILRDAIQSVGGYTEEKVYLRFEDCNLWYKLYAAGYRGANLQEPLYKMRDDRNAYARRTVKTRLRAVYVQYLGFRIVHMKWYYYPLLLKDLIKGVSLAIMPSSLYMWLHRARLSH